MKEIDARGLSCPQPVIMTKAALASGDKEYIVWVDNEASRENVTRYAINMGYSAAVESVEDEYKLKLSKA